MRLIYADVLMDNISKKPSLNLFIHAKNIEAAIDETPTIDAEPVRHGRWIEVDRITWRIGDGDKFDTTVEEKCSNCGRHVERYETEKQENYCSTCGSKMDLEV